MFELMSFHSTTISNSITFIKIICSIRTDSRWPGRYSTQGGRTRVLLRPWAKARTPRKCSAWLPNLPEKQQEITFVNNLFEWYKVYTRLSQMLRVKPLYFKVFKVLFLSICIWHLEIKSICLPQKYLYLKG